MFSLSYTIIINAFKLNKLNYNKQIKNYISLIFLLLNIIVSILILIRTKKEGTDNKLIKSVLKRVVHSLDNGIDLNVLSGVLAGLNSLIHLQDDRPEYKHKHKIIPSGHHNLKLFINRGSGILCVQKVNETVS